MNISSDRFLTSVVGDVASQKVKSRDERPAGKETAEAYSFRFGFTVGMTAHRKKARLPAAGQPPHALAMDV